MRRRIGIDVGGTNTDAVLLEDDRVLHAVKTPTTADVLTGVRLALESAAQAMGSEGVQAVMIGTTHFVNAVVQRRDLAKVGALRLGLPASKSLPPCVPKPTVPHSAVTPRRDHRSCRPCATTPWCRARRGQNRSCCRRRFPC